MTGSLPSRPRPSSSAPNILRSMGRPGSTNVVPRSQTMSPRSPKPRKGSSPFLPPPDPTQRAFDVLINFLPATGIPDGYLLKNAILVTTISRPFVIATSGDDSSKKKARTQSVSDKKRGSKWSIFRQSSKDLNAPMPPPVDSTSSLGHGSRSPPSIADSKFAPSIASTLYPPSAFESSTNLYQTFSNTNPALTIHILPSPPPHPHNYVYTHKQMAARDKLVSSIDQFLCAFGASQASFLPRMGKAPEHLKGSIRGDDKRAFALGAIPRARPYLVDANSFANDVFNATGDTEGEWSLAELICCGCLDSNPSPASLSEGKGEHRVWISGISDIIISSSSQSGSVGDETPRSLTPEGDSTRNPFEQHPPLPPTRSRSPAVEQDTPTSRPLPSFPNAYPQPVQRQQSPVARPIPVQYQHPQLSNNHFSPPTGLPAQTQPHNYATSTLNNDSSSSADTRSSHGFPGTPGSLAPPPPPEKDFEVRPHGMYSSIQQQVHQQQQLQSQKTYEMHYSQPPQPQLQNAFRRSQGYQTGNTQNGNLSNGSTPQPQPMANGFVQPDRSRYISNDLYPPRQPTVPRRRLSKYGPTSNNVRTPSPQNQSMRPTSYLQSSETPLDTIRKWKFWKWFTQPLDILTICNCLFNCFHRFSVTHIIHWSIFSNSFLPSWRLLDCLSIFWTCWRYCTYPLNAILKL